MTSAPYLFCVWQAMILIRGTPVWDWFPTASKPAHPKPPLKRNEDFGD
jgi:hypothetical protein